MSRVRPSITIIITRIEVSTNMGQNLISSACLFDESLVNWCYFWLCVCMFLCARTIDRKREPAGFEWHVEKLYEFQTKWNVLRVHGTWNCKWWQNTKKHIVRTFANHRYQICTDIRVQHEFLKDMFIFIRLFSFLFFSLFDLLWGRWMNFDGKKNSRNFSSSCGVLFKL